MDYELFSKTIVKRNRKRVCRFCLAESALRHIETETIAQLCKQITNENLSLSSDHPTFVCSTCELSLRAAVKIRNDIIEIEKCWSKFIDANHNVPIEVKNEAIEDEDGENTRFEMVEMTIEPVDETYTAYDVDYLYFDSKSDYDRKFDANSLDEDSVGNYDESFSDYLDDHLENSSRGNSKTLLAERNNCEHCDDVTGLSPNELRLHMRNTHPELTKGEQFMCDICEARYSSRYGIRTHMKRHMVGAGDCGASTKNVKRYKCSQCDERFSKKVLLEEHELRHSGAALHVCHICGVGKRTKGRLNTHIKTHDPDYVSKKNSSSKSKSSKRYFTCWMCPNRIDFKTLDELKTHRKELHHAFQCKFCKNGFMTNEALQSHILIHGEQDRPHMCKICGGTFAKIGHLKSHMHGKHAEQKPYPCDKCTKGFVHSYQLQAHIRITHDKIKAFQCTECSRSFGHAKSRVWHMRTVHKM